MANTRERLPFLSEKVSKFFYSRWYFIILTLAAMIFYALRLEPIGVLVMISVVLIILVLQSDTLPTTLPFWLICMMVLRMYGSYNTWIKLWPAIFVVVPALLFHFIYYRPTYKTGKLFLAYLAVSIAVTLGGIGAIGASAYLKSTYYVLGLGFGMLGIYVLLNAHVSGKGYDLKEYFTRIMLYVGLFGVFTMVFYYATNLREVIGNLGDDSKLQMGNNLSTNLLITMPFAFYAAIKSKYKTLFFNFGIFQYLAMASSLSRSGILMGTVMVFICIVFALIKIKGQDRLFCILSLLCYALMAAVFLTAYWHQIYEEISIKTGEARTGLYRHAVEMFIKYPVFGTGLGYQGQFYYPQKGGMYWYHSSPFQIIASLGIVGAVAFVFQYVMRLKMLFVRRTVFNMTVFLSYLGFELMSCVNPGEFCPLPYVLIVVEMFVIAEKDSDKTLSCEDLYFKRDISKALKKSV